MGPNFPTFRRLLDPNDLDEHYIDDLTDHLYHLQGADSFEAPAVPQIQSAEITTSFHQSDSNEPEPNDRLLQPSANNLQHLEPGAPRQAFGFITSKLPRLFKIKGPDRGACSPLSSPNSPLLSRCRWSSSSSSLPVFNTTSASKSSLAVMFPLPDRASHPYSLRPRASSVTTRIDYPSIDPLGFNRNLLNHHPLGQPFPGDADATPVEQAARASSGRMNWTRERRDYLTQSLVMSDICSDSPEALREIIVGDATMDTLKRVVNSGQDVPAPSSNERVLHPSPSSEVDGLAIPPGLVGLHP
ncbi:hypothetical protein PTTG_28511 [Puccinia triticina 1-1 BBBD Race 1]|uniref:Uncharacterized protein n=1 Tax=Puccinia triticina (isolate 1-1 / race 1 (BBBD)) TaxID=630390 RepID=A0A180GBE1_PUCT1|nr:hypothetical protein PTTG_28511 [Puccinia triticina 1-1 BBBD Race 1]